jgi:radical SAM PhpK family P-methyltransferase
MNTETIDCVVVGYNDSSFDALFQKTARYKDTSGGFRHLMANSLVFGGKRVKYADVLNLCLERATGKPSRRHVGQMANLGACYLTSFLKARGYEAELVNFFNHERDRFADLLAGKVRMVAITTTYYFEPEPIQELVQFVREHNEDAIVIVGGPHIFNLCTDYRHDPRLLRSLLAQMGADVYVFDSQGELTLGHICGELRGIRPDISQIPNLLYSTDGWETMCQTPRKIENNDMNLNAVNWSHFGSELVVPTVQTRTARSCAFKCAFCRYPVMAGSLDLVDLDLVEKELDYFQSTGVRYLLFIDDTFNIPEPRFKELCRRMIARRYDFQWFSYFRCANADDECFDLMARAGCKGVFLGIESGDQDVLRVMRKAAKVDRYLHGIKMLNERGIITYSSFIVGHPGETFDTVHNTFEFIEQAQPSFYCLESFFFDPKTPIGTQTAEHQLEGAGYRWKHKGMDWTQAADLVELGYRSIRGSTVLPLYSFDLWSFAYLLGTGVEEAKLTKFLQSASDIMVGTINDPAYCTPEREQKLEAIFRPH